MIIEQIGASGLRERHDEMVRDQIPMLFRGSTVPQKKQFLAGRPRCCVNAVVTALWRLHACRLGVEPTMVEERGQVLRGFFSFTTTNGAWTFTTSAAFVCWRDEVPPTLNPHLGPIVVSTRRRGVPMRTHLRTLVPMGGAGGARWKTNAAQRAHQKNGEARAGAPGNAVGILPETHLVRVEIIHAVRWSRDEMNRGLSRLREDAPGFLLLDYSFVLLMSCC